MSLTRPDHRSRVSLPYSLRDFAGHQGGVIVSGVSERLEFQEPERWNAAISLMQDIPPYSSPVSVA